MIPGLRFILTVTIVSSLTYIALSQSNYIDIGSEDVLKKIELSLYPNPASNSTTVSIEFGINETSLDIFILEMHGKIISEYNYDHLSGSKEFTLPLDHLINGIYNVAVQTNESYHIEQLIVLRWTCFGWI